MTRSRGLLSVAMAGAVLLADRGLHAAQQPARTSQRPEVTTVSAVPPPATRLETTLNLPNTLVTRDLYRVTDRLAASFGLTVDAVVANATFPTPDHLLGVRVEVHDSGPPDHVRTSYVDQVELAGLSQALGQMIASAAQWTGREDSRATEAQFATLGGFVVGFHQDSRNQQGYVIAGVIDPARHVCAVADFPVIKTAIDDAITLLRDK
jgi:hypothetical protein